MKLLLIQPGYGTDVPGFRRVALPEPLHLEMVAGTLGLDTRHELRILDMRLDNDLHATLHDFAPEMVAITALTPEVYTAQAILEQVKAFSAEMITVVGGHHATLLPGDFLLPQVDIVALGVSELMFARLVETVAEMTAAKGSQADRSPLKAVPNLIWQDSEGVFRKNPETTDRVKLDQLALPRRDLARHYRDDYFFLFDKPDTAVATSRGCPYRCNFCSVHEFYKGRCSQMSPERVMRELRTVETNHVTFLDDNFLTNFRREQAIAEMIRSEGLQLRFSMEARADAISRHPELVANWVDIGLYAVLLGLEGASEDTLTNVNKSSSIDTNNRALEILHDHGVIVWGAFIVDPGWGEDDFDRLADYVHSKRITHTQFTVLTPLPGTQLYRQRKNELLTHHYSCFDTLHAVLPTRLPRERFYQRFAQLYRQSNLAPYYDLVQQGKLTIENCKQGKAILDSMANWESYLPGDPILGQLTPHPQAASPPPVIPV